MHSVYLLYLVYITDITHTRIFPRGIDKRQVCYFVPSSPVPVNVHTFFPRTAGLNECLYIILVNRLIVSVIMIPFSRINSAYSTYYTSRSIFSKDICFSISCLIRIDYPYVWCQRLDYPQKPYRHRPYYPDDPLYQPYASPYPSLHAS